MVLYHVTTETKGNCIIRDGAIKINSPSSFKEEKTEKGFIYLSNRISIGYDIVKRTVSDNDNYMYIFKICIPEKELLPDFDEAKIKKCISSDAIGILNECFSTRVDFDINLKKYNVEFTKLPSIWNKTLFLERFPNTSCEIFDEIKCLLSNLHNKFNKEIKEIEENEKKFEENLKWEKC
jgi:hypothetical protein